MQNRRFYKYGLISISITIFICVTLWLAVYAMRRNLFQSKLFDAKSIQTEEVISVTFREQIIMEHDSIQAIVNALKTIEPARPGDGALYNLSGMLSINTTDGFYEYYVRITNIEDYALVEIGSYGERSATIYGYASSSELKEALTTLFD